MHSRTIHSLIASFLEGDDLVQYSQVCRVCYTASLDPTLWKRETLRTFALPSLDQTTSEVPPTNWRALFLAGRRLQLEAANCSSSFLTAQDTSVLFEEVWSSLRDPMLMFPPLRRDLNAFPTLFQDLLANPFDRVEAYLEESPYSAELRSILDTHEALVFSELQMTNELEAFSALCFAVGRQLQSHTESTTSSEVVGCGRCPPQSFALRFLTLLRSTVAFHCRLLRSLMQELSGVALLEFYIDKWTAYANSVVYLNELLSPFTVLAEQLVGAGLQLDVVIFMRQVWCEVLHKPLEDRLNTAYVQGVLGELELIRSTGDYSYESACVYMGFYDCICDLSFEESTIYLKLHSKLSVSSPLATLHRQVAKAILSVEPLAASHILNVLDAEHRFLSCCLLPCAMEQIEQARRREAEQLLTTFEGSSAASLQSYKWKLDELLSERAFHNTRIEQIAKDQGCLSTGK